MNKTVKKILQNYIASTGKGHTAFIIMFWIFLAILAAIEPLIFTQVIKLIEQYISTWEVYISNIINISVIWITFTISFIVLAYVFDYFFLAKTIITNFHVQSLHYANRIIKMSFNEYLWKQVGSLYKILDRWTENQLFFLYTLLLWVLRNATQIVFITILLFIIDWRMAIATLILLPVAIYIGFFIYNKVSPTQKKLDKEYIKWFWILWNWISNFWLTKTLNLEDVFYKKMKDIFDVSYQKQLRINMWWSISHWYTAGIVILSRILVVALWFYLITLWEISFATLFLFFSYIGWIYFPLSFLFDQLRQFQKFLTAVELMHDEFDSVEFEEINIWKNIKNPQWNILFNNVTFWYSKEKNILKKINLDIKSGQKIALVWNTWAGKSTLVNLLLRFWDVNSWEILLDGINIDTLKKSSLRNHIWVVSQDNSLFNLSIEENLKFANPNATKKEIMQALKIAEAEFVLDLPNGIKTVIWERWLKLSGGEKQRISIARLFLKNPEILILDEATSALDNLTEMKIEKALKKLMKWKTSIIIAHRLSTIQHADMIYMLENGKIVESWNYPELMKQKKKFYNLANPDKLILW